MYCELPLLLHKQLLLCTVCTCICMYNTWTRIQLHTLCTHAFWSRQLRMYMYTYIHIHVHARYKLILHCVMQNCNTLLCSYMCTCTCTCTCICMLSKVYIMYCIQAHYSCTCTYKVHVYMYLKTPPPTYQAWCQHYLWARHSDPWCHDGWPCSCEDDSDPEQHKDR